MLDDELQHYIQERLPRTGTLVIFNQHGDKYLLLLESKSRRNEWEIPGGEIQNLPSSKEAAREVQEETGLTINPHPCLPNSTELVPQIDVVTGSGKKRKIQIYVYQAEIPVDHLPLLSLTEHHQSGFLKLPSSDIKDIQKFYLSLNLSTLNLLDSNGQLLADNITLSKFSDVSLRRYLQKNYY